jgi:hypothetical protein
MGPYPEADESNQHHQSIYSRSVFNIILLSKSTFSNAILHISIPNKYFVYAFDIHYSSFILCLSYVSPIYHYTVL